MFSVIMPVYNGEKFVSTAVECVISQTFAEWELVIVNDGSKDNTLKVLEKYADNPKIKVITQPNGGVSAARNTAMKNARFDYFAFLDCDDFWFPNHLEILKKMIDRYPAAGTYSTLANIQLPNGDCITNASYFENRPDKTDDSIVYIENFIAEYDRDKMVKTYPSCSCISRAASEKAGVFRTGCKIGEYLAFFLTAGVYYPTVLSRDITTIYERGNSTATKDVSFDPDWFFFEEVNDILNDREVSDETKQHLISVMQWFTMRRARHYAIDGRRRDAWKSFKEIGRNPSLAKDKLITFILLLMPTFLVKKIFMIRWRTQG